MSKTARAVFGKDTESRQRAEHPPEGRRVTVRFPGQFVHCLRLRPEEIGDAESSYHVDRLDDEGPRPDEIHDSGHRCPPIPNRCATAWGTEGGCAAPCARAEHAGDTYRLSSPRMTSTTSPP